MTIPTTAATTARPIFNPFPPCMRLPKRPFFSTGTTAIVVVAGTMAVGVGMEGAGTGIHAASNMDADKGGALVAGAGVDADGADGCGCNGGGRERVTDGGVASTDDRLRNTWENFCCNDPPPDDDDVDGPLIISFFGNVGRGFEKKSRIFSFR